MKSTQNALFCLVILLPSACAYDTITPSTTTLSTVNNVGINPHVYVAGTVGSTAVIWKNGVADTLDQGEIRSIFVDGVDVYAAGWKWQSKVINSLPYNIAVAAYWKNGTLVVLSDTSRNSYVQSIYVANGHVHAVGHEESLLFGSGIPFRAKYWKDGIPVTLSISGAFMSDAIGVYVSGDDVYVSGWTGILGKGLIATYWRNGDPVYLTEGTEDCTAASVFVSGNDVYVAGTVKFQDINIDGGFIIPSQADCRATYWKNGKATTLSSVGSYASSIFVNGTDVYVAGTMGSETAGAVTTPFGPTGGNVATYWKNGVQVTLNDDHQESLASSISVTQNGEVYLAGTISNQAAYWVNGSRTILGRPSDQGINSYLYSVFLTN